MTSKNPLLKKLAEGLSRAPNPKPSAPEPLINSNGSDVPYFSAERGRTINTASVRPPSNYVSKVSTPSNEHHEEDGDYSLHGSTDTYTHISKGQPEDLHEDMVVAPMHDQVKKNKPVPVDIGSATNTTATAQPAKPVAANTGSAATAQPAAKPVTTNTGPAATAQPAAKPVTTNTGPAANTTSSTNTTATAQPAANTGSAAINTGSAATAQPAANTGSAATAQPAAANTANDPIPPPGVTLLSEKNLSNSLKTYSSIKATAYNCHITEFLKKKKSAQLTNLSIAIKNTGGQSNMIAWESDLLDKKNPPSSPSIASILYSSAVINGSIYVKISDASKRTNMANTQSKLDLNMNYNTLQRQVTFTYNDSLKGIDIFKLLFKPIVDNKNYVFVNKNITHPVMLSGWTNRLNPIKDVLHSQENGYVGTILRDATDANNFTYSTPISVEYNGQTYLVPINKYNNVEIFINLFQRYMPGNAKVTYVDVSINSDQYIHQPSIGQGLNSIFYNNINYRTSDIEIVAITDEIECIIYKILYSDCDTLQLMMNTFYYFYSENPAIPSFDKKSITNLFSKILRFKVDSSIEKWDSSNIKNFVRNTKAQITTDVRYTDIINIMTRSSNDTQGSGQITTYARWPFIFEQIYSKVIPDAQIVKDFNASYSAGLNYTLSKINDIKNKTLILPSFSSVYISHLQLLDDYVTFLLKLRIMYPDINIVMHDMEPYLPTKDDCVELNIFTDHTSAGSNNIYFTKVAPGATITLQPQPQQQTQTQQTQQQPQKQTQTQQTQQQPQKQSQQQTQTQQSQQQTQTQQTQQQPQQQPQQQTQTQQTQQQPQQQTQTQQTQQQPQQQTQTQQTQQTQQQPQQQTQTQQTQQPQQQTQTQQTQQQPQKQSQQQTQTQQPQQQTQQIIPKNAVSIKNVDDLRALFMTNYNEYLKIRSGVPDELKKYKDIIGFKGTLITVQECDGFIEACNNPTTILPKFDELVVKFNTQAAGIEPKSRGFLKNINKFIPDYAPTNTGTSNLDPKVLARFFSNCMVNYVQYQKKNQTWDNCTAALVATNTEWFDFDKYKS